ncbi:MAG: cell division protein FtsQ/DivIB [Halothiobacillus sp.]|jgi:cell division protein FtsQ|nr:cell division protein FtsQ/DivIB [Halothiobacillus sp.]
MGSARRPVQARPRSPSLREQWDVWWSSLKRAMAVLFTWFITLSLLGLLVLAGWGFWQKLQLPVTEIRVVGAEGEISADWVRSELKPLIGQDIWQVSLPVARALLLQNTWLTDARIQRVWPNALAVQVSIHHPIARWQGDQLLDTEGNVFLPTGKLPEKVSDLPQLSGPDGQQWVLWERYLSFKSALQTVGLNTTGLFEDSRGSLDVIVQGGVRIRLGVQQIEPRLQRLLDVYGKTLAGKLDQVAAIDLRYSNGFSVVWRAAPTTVKKAERQKQK